MRPGGPQPELKIMTSTRIQDLSTQSRASSLDGSAFCGPRLRRLSTGSTLGNGRFEIRGQLGAGGMGVVYEAYDRWHERRVALKTGHLLQPEATYRLKGEFRALRGVQHPNLVQLYELFAEQELWYFTMTLVEGVDFGTWFASPTRTAAELRQHFAQLANGVHAIHQAGKIHRDLKPSNIIVSPEGRVVILDFGLVSDAVAGGVGQTQVDGRISGTPAYLSPEQAYGGPASEAGDWYAFGVMLYQALSGDLPFSKSHPWGQVNGAGLNSIQTLRPNATPELAELCLSLLANEPSSRPRFAEVSTALGGNLVACETATPSSPPAICSVRNGRTSRLERALRETRRGLMHVLAVSEPNERFDVTTRLRTLADNGGALVLHGSCHEEESIPFNGLDGIIDALSHHLAKLPRDRAAALLPRDVSELARLFPVLNRVDVVAESPCRLEGAGDTIRRSHAALSELLSRISDRQPVVLLLEGLEHADEETLEFARALLDGEPIPVLVVLLSASSGPRLAPLLRAVQRCPWARIQPPRERFDPPSRLDRGRERGFDRESSAA